ncbi:MAG: mercuric transporter MerT family protein [Terriglobia bacterium]
MNEKFLALGSALAAFGASLCCLGPLVLGGLGLGAALTATFAPLRPYFLTVSAVLLALGFYFVYRIPKPTEACAGEVCAPEGRARRWAKPVLWLATLAVAALAFFPSYAGRLLSTPAVGATLASAPLETVELDIGGMTCEACAGLVQNTLLETSGVTAAAVDYPAGRATVRYDPAQTAPAKLIEAVNATGYTASLPKPQQE